MEQALEDKIRYCAKLLANSLLAEEYKEVISSSFSQMTEKSLDKVIESLEKEKEQLDKLGAALKEFDADQDKKWEAVRKAQEAKAKELEDAFLADVIEKNITQ
jgi:hypothetical protein